jgi:hypothetical protein
MLLRTPSSLVVAGAILLSPSAALGELRFESRTEYRTSLRLTFKPQEVRPTDGGVWVWGDVANRSFEKKNYVTVTFTALDDNGKFLERSKTYVDPTALASKEVGAVDDYIDTDGKTPAVIQYKIDYSK